MQVLEHQHHRRRRAFGSYEILPRAAHLIAHQHGILPRRAELHAVVVGKRRTHELTEKLGHPPLLARRHTSGHPRTNVRLPLFAGLRLRNAACPPEHLRHEPERGPGGHRIAAPSPDFDGRCVAGGEAAQSRHQFIAHARLARSGGGGDEHGARHGLSRTLREDRFERGELAFATDARSGRAEQRARLFVQLALAGQLQPPIDLAHVEARGQEARGEFVDHDGVGPGSGRVLDE